VTHQELRDLLPAYALDALAPEEAREVEVHLATCETCPGELRTLRQVAAELGEAVTESTPPAGLRAAVLEAIRPQPVAGAEPPVRLGRRQLLFPRGWAVGLAAAAAVVVALAGMGISVNRRLSDLQERLAAQEAALALLTSPAAKTTVLAGTVPANVRFVYDPAGGRGALVVADLRDPGVNLVYQLWLIGGEEPVSAGVFRPVSGRPVIVPIATEFQRYRAVAISVERAPRGARQPTTTPILSGAI
jgi:anti-sigma-K factor RskA